MKKKFLLTLLALSLIGAPVSAADIDGMTLEELKAAYTELLEKYNALIDPVETDTVLYDGEYGVLTLKEIEKDWIVFEFKNTSDQDLQLLSDYILVDDKQFQDGQWGDGATDYWGFDTYGSTAAGSRRQYNYHVELEDIEITDISGQIEVCNYPDGEVLGSISF